MTDSLSHLVAPVDDTGLPADLLSTASALLRAHYRWMTAGAIVGSLLFLSPLLFTSRTYTSSVSFIPQARRQASALSGLAAQFGISSGDATSGPAFYSELVRARVTLEAVVRQVTPPQLGGKPVGEILTTKGSTPEQRTDFAIAELDSRIVSSASPKTGIVSFAVTDRSAAVARYLATSILDAINSFNVNARQSQAAAERRFTERRLAEVREELRQSETAVEDFLTHNRGNIALSPQLSTERDRLTRAVEARREVVASLAQSFEQAKIDEVRDTPVITIINAPELPMKPDSRGGFRRLIIGVTLGAAVGGLLSERRRRRAREQS